MYIYIPTIHMCRLEMYVQIQIVQEIFCFKTMAAVCWHIRPRGTGCSIIIVRNVWTFVGCHNAEGRIDV